MSPFSSISDHSDFPMTDITDFQRVPCHRIICANGAIGGFKGEAQDTPSGINQEEKLGLLKAEGIDFDETGQLVDVEKWWGEFRV
ncbi:hypothetical protein SBOR_9859 [Sclerotinia borealis F-4128]|uniref:Uncharacterized protein n=1 Tax=Sclerotinia borealis (strain F-4128) TaxID=1432307 RepID=W9C4A9_SCLBF|nr:hypothetical protein SBOR_9859 [Sclerotinia borealis F-4128]